MRTSRLRNLPLALRGIGSVRNQIFDGILYAERSVFKNARISSAVISMPGFEHDHRGDFFAETVVGHAEHDGFDDVVVVIDRGLDLAAVHVLAAADHHVLGAVDDEHQTVFVDAGDVAGVQPAVLDRCRRWPPAG